MIVSPSTTFNKNQAYPKFYLDFATGALDPRVTFSRALNTATRVNSSGVIESVNANLPRFDYDLITLSSRGLLIEETRTNSVLYSSDISNPYWLKFNLNTTGTPPYSDVALAPDGTNTADKLIANTANDSHFIYVASLLAAGQNSLSIFAKKGEYKYFAIGNGSTGHYAIFDLDAGIIVSVTPASTITNAKIEPYKDGWFRVSCLATVAGASTMLYGPADPATGTFINFAGNNVNGLFVWGFQREQGAFVTSYIPTTSAAVTRNADVATITGTSFSSFWAPGRGSALVRARPSTVSGSRPCVQFDDGTANNIISLRGNAANPELYIKATTDQAQIDAGTIAAGARYRLAGAWATNDCAASINGGSPVRDGVAVIPTVTQARLGSDGTNYLNGHLEAIEYYDERVLSSSLQVVSSTAGYRSIIGPVFRDTIIS